MSLECKVVCVGPVDLDFIFDPIVDGVRQQGHEVVYYSDYAQFERDPGVLLGSAGVLVATSDSSC